LYLQNLAIYRQQLDEMSHWSYQSYYTWWDIESLLSGDVYTWLNPKLDWSLKLYDQVCSCIFAVAGIVVYIHFLWMVSEFTFLSAFQVSYNPFNIIGRNLSILNNFKAAMGDGNRMWAPKIMNLTIPSHPETMLDGVVVKNKTVNVSLEFVS
jgi:hypothetical protein